MKQKYSEHCPKHAATQPPSSLSASSSFTATTSVPAEQHESPSSLAETGNQATISKPCSKTNQTKASSRSSKGATSTKAISTKAASSQIARGIPKSFSFSSLYRNANKHKSVVQRQQSENTSSLPSDFEATHQHMHQPSAQQPLLHHQHSAPTPPNYACQLHNAARLIQHPQSMDYGPPYQHQVTCPRQGAYQFAQGNQMIENVPPNLAGSARTKRLKTTHSLHSMQNLEEEDLFGEHRCELHQHKSSQTDALNADDGYGPAANSQPISYIANFPPPQQPYLKNLPPAHSLPPSHHSHSHLPASSSLKPSYSFPSPQSISCTSTGCQHAYLNYLQQNEAGKSDHPNGSNFYGFIASTGGKPAAGRTSSGAKAFANQVNLELAPAELALQQQRSNESPYADGDGTGENYYSNEQQAASLTSESCTSTGGILNAMAEILDDEESASRFDVKMFSNSLEEFDDRLNATIGYSLDELEEAREEESERLAADELRGEAYSDAIADSEREQIKNELQLQRRAIDERAREQEAYYASFKSNNLASCPSKVCGHDADGARKEANLREENNNERCDYQLERSGSQVSDIQKDEHQPSAIKEPRSDFNKLEHPLHRAVASSGERREKEGGHHRTAESVVIETKKRLRDSTSTDSSLINDKKIKKPDARSAKGKRDWFFRQISNSSKSYSSSTNCDTCSIITTNPDTVEDDNVFAENNNSNKFGNEATGRRTSVTAFGLLNQTRNKLAQLRSQIKQQTSVESDQSAFTTISVTGASSRQLSRQASQSSFGLKNLFKMKRRLSQRPNDTPEPAERKGVESAANEGDRASRKSEGSTSKQPAGTLHKQHYKRDKCHSKVKTKHTRTVNTVGGRKKCIGGIKSRPLKPIVHPLERSITGFFVITLFFTMLAIISGVPIVCLLCLCLPFAVAIRNLITCDFRTSYSTGEHRVTPNEHYWLNSTWKNNCKKGVALCLLTVDPGFTLEQCRDLIQSRIIQKVGTERFRWVLRFKGKTLSGCSSFN